MSMGETYVIDLGRREAVPCECKDVSLFCASLIPQDWMRKASHQPATLCRCGKSYYSWRAKEAFPAKELGS